MLSCLGFRACWIAVMWNCRRGIRVKGVLDTEQKTHRAGRETLILTRGAHRASNQQSQPKLRIWVFERLWRPMGLVMKQA